MRWDYSHDEHYLSVRHTYLFVCKSYVICMHNTLHIERKNLGYSRCMLILVYFPRTKYHHVNGQWTVPGFLLYFVHLLSKFLPPQSSIVSLFLHGCIWFCVLWNPKLKLECERHLHFAVFRVYCWNLETMYYVLCTFTSTFSGFPFLLKLLLLLLHFWKKLLESGIWNL